MKYHIRTYGCQMNKSDSERIARVLEEIGFRPSPTAKGADLLLVNICSVRQSAVDRAISKIKSQSSKIKNTNQKSKIILTGCILEKDKKEFQKFCDAIFNINNLPELPGLVKSLGFQVQGGKSKEVEHYLKLKPEYQSEIIAYVPIMTGCDNFCTYCVVPYTRGREISRPAEEILCEVKELVKRGIKEIWLLGQNVNRYRSNSKTKTQNSKIINFAKLLEMVNNLSDHFWIRFTSPNPADFTDELIETMAKCKKVTPYLNLPVQSGDDEILKRMNRPYTVCQYKNLVKKIRAAFRKYRKGLEKEIALSTDIIVGFPGETKEQFENTAKLMREIKFDMAYISRYSPRPGTPAAKMKDDVSQKEKKRREKVLTEILKKTALQNNKKFIGKEVLVLPEEFKNGFLIGKSRHYKTVKFLPRSEGDKDLIGNFLKIKIVDALPWGLKATLS